MKRHLFWTMSFLWILCMVALPWDAAAAVGHFDQVEGPVDILRGGKLPAIPIKMGDAVESGDVVRTKSSSKAKVKFIDDTTLLIAPASRVAIEEYSYNAEKGQRKATLKVFQGLVETVVSKIIKMEEPDFLMKTHTALIGVRGTTWYTKVLPNDTEVFTEKSRLEVRNLYPEIPGVVTLKSMEYTRVGMNIPPTVPMPITEDDIKNLKMQFSLDRRAGKTSDSQFVQVASADGIPSVINAQVQLPTPTPIAIPVVLSSAQTPEITIPMTFNINGTYTTSSSAPFRVEYATASGIANYSGGPISGLFNYSLSSINSIASGTGTFPASASGPYTAILNGTFTGRPGQAFIGNITSGTVQGVSFSNVAVPIQVSPTGAVLLDTSRSGTYNGVNISATIAPGSNPQTGTVSVTQGGKTITSSGSVVIGTIK